MRSWTKQFRVLFAQFGRAELANRERFFSPILFSVTILIMFSFSFGDVPPELTAQVFISQAFLTAFFALQISLTRAFEPDLEDDAFTLMRTYPLHPEAWFLSKYLIVFLMSCCILLPTMAVAAFLVNKTTMPSLDVFIIATLATLGMSAIGVLLAAMVQKSDAKQMLFPLIYFPLVTPVLLAAVNASLAVMNDGTSLADMLANWVGLLLIFAVIYVTLGLLLFGELVKSD